VCSTRRSVRDLRPSLRPAPEFGARATRDDRGLLAGYRDPTVSAAILTLVAGRSVSCQLDYDRGWADPRQFGPPSVRRSPVRFTSVGAKFRVDRFARIRCVRETP